eukprot:gene1066-biopygen294
MESSESDSSQSSSRTSSFSDYEKEIEEFEADRENTCKAANDFDPDFVEAYADEPLADEEWVRDYEEKRAADDKRYKEFEEQLKMESTLEECTELVLAEVGEVPNCITLHPGFGACCPSAWSLRLAGTRYKTRQKKRYYQLRPNEAESYLRAVSYREFTRLVHGILGKKRKLLPACAYFAIRKKFPTDTEFTGFEDLPSES